MNKYESMSDDEINKALAVGIVGWEKYQDRQEWCAPSQGKYIMDFEDWCPCDKDSNQLVNYVFPKLREDEDVKIGTLFMGPWFCFEIRKWHYISERILNHDYSDMLAEFETKDFDKINRTIAEACLEAYEKLNEGKE